MIQTYLYWEIKTRLKHIKISKLNLNTTPLFQIKKNNAKSNSTLKYKYKAYAYTCNKFIILQILNNKNEI